MNELRKFLDERRGGIAIGVVGAAGTGKSSFLGSVGKLFNKNEVLLLAPKPREINSWRYAEYGFNASAEVFQDSRWKPALGLFEASAFTKLEKRVLELYDDAQHRVVILDPYTDVVKLAARDILKSEKAATPKDSSDSRGFYGALKHRLSNFTSDLVNLSSPALKVPKIILVAVHAQSAKEEEKLSGSGVRFEGDVLPMIEGGHRNDFAGEFDIVAFTKIKHSLDTTKKPPVKNVQYLVQVSADAKRHAKVALMPAGTVIEMENDVVKLLERVFLK